MVFVDKYRSTKYKYFLQLYKWVYYQSKGFTFYCFSFFSKIILTYKDVI